MSGSYSHSLLLFEIREEPAITDSWNNVRFRLLLSNKEFINLLSLSFTFSVNFSFTFLFFLLALLFISEALLLFLGPTSFFLFLLFSPKAFFFFSFFEGFFFTLLLFTTSLKFGFSFSLFLATKTPIDCLVIKIYI